MLASELTPEVIKCLRSKKSALLAKHGAQSTLQTQFSDYQKKSAMLSNEAELLSLNSPSVVPVAAAVGQH